MKHVCFFAFLVLIFLATSVYGQNIGIGVALPQDRLDVNGNVRSTGLRISGQNILELGFGLTKQADNGKIGLNVFGEANTLSIVGGGTAGDGSDRRIKMWADGGTAYTGGASFMGNVGLSVASNSIAKLQVNGRGGTPFSIGIIDSATNAAGVLLFANVNRPSSGLALRGSSFGSGSNQNNLSISSYDGNVLFMTVRGDGNVGIGIATPLNDKLTVAGGINLTGKLKINADSGKTGQVLAIDENGNPSWKDASFPYRFSRVFASTGSNTFTIPAGVKEIMIEQWGAGGGGSTSGGGSGSYSRYVLDVIAVASISVNNGTGGSGAAQRGDPGINGTSSSVTIGATTFLTAAGLGAQPERPGGNVASIVYVPGIPVTLKSFYGLPGNTGESLHLTGTIQTSCTSRYYVCGSGGHAPMAAASGGSAGTYSVIACDPPIGTLYSEATFSTPGICGSGGGGGLSGAAGGNGKTVIWW